MEVGLPLDRYSYRARLLPALITFLPVALAFGAWSFHESALWKLLTVLLTSFGFAMLLGQLGRDIGRNKQPELFKSWGGKPTTRLLSHRLSRLNANTLNRYHGKLRMLLPELRVPDSAEEMRHPSAALETYESCTLFLLEKTRDTKLFPLVFAENVNYGFRRNLWGWKPIGITVALVGIAADILFLVLRSNTSGQDERLFAIAAVGFNVALLVLWLFVINPNWVRVPAEAYAERLIGSVDNINV